MSDDAGFVRAIEENPRDPALRLIYADWLEERGDPRGEYLRLQCQLSEMSARLEQLAGTIDPMWRDRVREYRPGTSDLELQSGRTISLERLNQSYTYAGLLEGLPTTQMNRRLIERTLQEARGPLQFGEPYLIPPTEKPIEYHRDRPYPFGEPAALPQVVCVARFGSSQPARDASADCSTMVLVWFQDELALPIARHIIDQIRTIDWEQHAADGWY